MLLFIIEIYILFKKIDIPIAPVTWGAAMLVPFMSWLFLNVKLGTLVIAPPGAHTVIPAPPSIIGPRDDHVYDMPGIFSLKEYSATIISGDT